MSVRYEVVLEDGTRADYVLCDRHGRSLAVIEAKRFSISPGDAAEQAKNYARQLKVPYIFLANGNEIRFWEWQHEAYIETRPDGLNIADEQRDWWMFSQERDGWLSVVFCDLGIGIPGTLPIKKPTLWQRIELFGSKLDAHAIQEAIGESRTRTGLHHRGKGLKQLVDVVAHVDQGQIGIFSNKGRFTLKSQKESISQFTDSIYGTLIYWKVPLKGVIDGPARH